MAIADDARPSTDTPSGDTPSLTAGPEEASAAACLPNDAEKTPTPLQISSGTCRICGLTSEAGQLLNGKVGICSASQDEIRAAGPSDRLSVNIDGEDTPKLIKRCNLQIVAICKDASHAGVCTTFINPFGRSSLQFFSFGSAGATRQSLDTLVEKEQSVIYFDIDAVEELPIPLQFLVCCGPLADLPRAQAALDRLTTPALLLEHAEASNKPNLRPSRTTSRPEIGGTLAKRPASLSSLIEMDLPDWATLPETKLGGASGLGQLRGARAYALCTHAARVHALCTHAARVCARHGTFLLTASAALLPPLHAAPGVGLTALEWACKCGNLTIVEWLCADERSGLLLQTGCPLGWACNDGRLDVVCALDARGVDPLQVRLPMRLLVRLPVP